MSIRKKRNFRDLQLPATALGPNVDAEPVPSRVAPVGPRRRPLALRENGSSAHVDPSSLDDFQPSISSTIASLDPKPQYKEFDLKNDDFNILQELGQGNGGQCDEGAARTHRYGHGKEGVCFRIVLIDAKPAERKKILLELQIMHDCDSPYIVSSYGAYLAEPNICICMEFMDKGSFDGIYKRIGAIDIKVVGKVAVAVLEGLRYLYDEHRIIHRDIKPSNVLCNSNGEIKLCDFGVSGELVNSIANTFVGTSIYMSPERIQGATYSVKSDIWSLGITLIELSVGQFPFSGSFSDSEDSDHEHEREDEQLHSNRDSLQVPLSATTRRRNRRRSKGVSLHGGGMMMSIIELMHQIVNEPSPRLPSGKFGADAEAFVNGCLEKDIDARRTPAQLFDYAWIQHSRANTVDMKAWAATF
ncbi:STE/STE7/MEK1 protein kinase [Mycena sanguinolenta]|uniref:STE/STE7/MEK1 protein kinase n=1 Tax=Mycena sanguinolenta TaxID=230812 RepID=A0A8H6Z7X0_9AGAR|nr:STE/STE7/MEK1 protein kinase [Mycena sanguinolenta]